MNLTAIVAAADKQATNDLCESLGNGPNSLSVPLSTSPGVTNPALATHWAGSGEFMDAVGQALVVSVSPMVKTFTLDDGSDFATHIANATPTLYRIYEAI